MEIPNLNVTSINPSYAEDGKDLIDVEVDDGIKRSIVSIDAMAFVETFKVHASDRPEIDCSGISAIIRLFQDEPEYMVERYQEILSEVASCFTISTSEQLFRAAYLNWN